MKRMSSLKNQAIVLFTVLCMALLPYAVEVRAQTPGAADPPPPVETVPEPPAAEPPAPEPPAEEPPAPEPPAPEPPAEEPPAPEPPAEEPPVEEPPVEELPAEEPRVVEPPVEKPPAEEPVSEDPPAQEPADGEGTEGDGTTAPDSEPTEESTSEASTDEGEGEGETTETPDAESTEEASNESASTPESETVEEITDTGTPEPTSTEEVIVPDQLELVGDAAISIAPGEYRDVVVRYTLGSDREKTGLSANLTAPGGESLDDWTLIPWQRVDLDEDPEDANRYLKARIDHTENLENGDVFEQTWRITAPDHIEEPVTVRLHVSTKIHREDGVTDGVIKNDLVSISAVASEHNPTLTCDELIAEDVDNTWNCAFDTTHPDDDVVLTASADVPEGWNLTLNDVELTSEPLALSAEAIAVDGFTIAATYPIGCPDIDATFSSSMSLSMTYPSGEVSVLDADLPLEFERPTPTFEITSFGFNDMDLTQTLSTNGRMTVSYEDVPCAWHATLELTDLESDMFTIPKDLIHIGSVEGLPGATVSIADGSVLISADESAVANASGEFTIHFAIELPHQIPPGAYRIGVTTQFGWADQN